MVVVDALGSTVVVVVEVVGSATVVVVAGGTVFGSMVVTVTVVVVVAVGTVVGTETVVEVVVGTSPAIRGAGGVDTGGAVVSGIGVSGTGGKRSAKVVGRQAAWAGATATTDTKRAQAKKSVVARVLKVLPRLPARENPSRPKARHAPEDPGSGLLVPSTEARSSLPPGSRRNPSSR